MRFSTSFEQRDFFSKNGYIEFEGLISLDDCALIKEQAAGRDVWRSSGLLKKISLSPQLAEIAAVLSHKKSLRIAYDQRIQGEFKFLNHSIKPVIGLFVLLENEKVGNVIFFNPKFPPEKLANSFVIVYCEPKTQYLYEPKDPHTHLLKKLGYTFGELLRNDTHPLITY